LPLGASQAKPAGVQRFGERERRLGRLRSLGNVDRAAASELLAFPALRVASAAAALDFSRGGPRLQSCRNQAPELPPLKTMSTLVLGLREKACEPEAATDLVRIAGTLFFGWLITSGR